MSYQLVEIAEGTNKVILTVNLGSAPQSVAAAAGMVWLTTGHGQRLGQLVQIDPATGGVMATMHLAARTCLRITFSGRNLWAECAVSNTRTEFVRIDPYTGLVTGKVGPVSGFAGSIAAAPGGILYVGYNPNIYQVIQVGRRPAARSIKVSSDSYSSQQPLYGEGDVWTLSYDESVAKADLASGRVLRVYTYRTYDPGRAGGLDHFTVGNGSLWLLDDGYPFSGVLRVSVRTGRPLGAVAIPKAGDCGATPCSQIYSTPGAIWVPTAFSLIRIDPSRLPG
jgi:hypothetical protein